MLLEYFGKDHTCSLYVLFVTYPLHCLYKLWRNETLIKKQFYVPR